MIDERVMPMFPLGLALLPGSVLPLRLFEPRYLDMYTDVIDGAREFGVVLIERGIESRDDNPTFDIGCAAQILGSSLHDDGTITLVATGHRRIRIREWLPSDPYPRALVELLEDDALTEDGLVHVNSALDRLPRLMAMIAELDVEATGVTPRLSEEPLELVYQLAQLSGFQSLDIQGVLEAETSDQRAATVDRLMTEAVELVQMQLGMP